MLPSTTQSACGGLAGRSRRRPALLDDGVEVRKAVLPIGKTDHDGLPSYAVLSGLFGPIPLDHAEA
jgi:hypothetical protein